MLRRSVPILYRQVRRTFNSTKWNDEMKQQQLILNEIKEMREDMAIYQLDLINSLTFNAMLTAMSIATTLILHF